MNQSAQPLNVLLIDDDRTDIKAVERAFRSNDLPCTLHVANDGQEGLDRLRGTGGHAQVPEPRIVVADIRMPMMSGLEFLSRVRCDPRLSSTVALVVTTSDHERDLKEAYRLNVAAYILKSALGESLQPLVAFVREYATSVSFSLEKRSP